MSASSVPRGVLVAHALGAIAGVTYTNSLEALRCNHKRGFRWFEVDLALTADGELVAFHTQHERFAGLTETLDRLPFAEVERARYRGRFAIPRFSAVLAESRALGDVVLVTDTKSWTPSMLEAVERTVKAASQAESPARLVLQSYGEKDIASVTRLAKEIGAGVILTLYKTRASDQVVEKMARDNGVVAVVAQVRRFTPWLAERLHAAKIPVLVHTVNDHAQMVSLVRAGADGFYTDEYVPYAMMAERPEVLLECGAATPSDEQLRPWLVRDLTNERDYRLSSCAKRTHEGKRVRLELAGCDEQAAVTGPFLAVPAPGAVHIELEVEAPREGAELWFHVLPKDGLKPKRPRDELKLEAGERRKYEYDVTLPAGSPGVETRLGLKSPSQRLVVHRLSVTQTQRGQADAPAAPPLSSVDGG
jgi:glycerophosphoryl diester phosphodiesterase